MYPDGLPRVLLLRCRPVLSQGFLGRLLLVVDSAWSPPSSDSCLHRLGVPGCRFHRDNINRHTDCRKYFRQLVH
jgi:hypothetical protein